MKGKNQPPIVRIFFTPDEFQVLAMGLGLIIEDLNAPATKLQPWNPETRKGFKDIAAAAASAAIKIEKFGGVKVQLPPYNPGDENEFFTKPS